MTAPNLPSNDATFALGRPGVGPANAQGADAPVVASQTNSGTPRDSQDVKPADLEHHADPLIGRVFGVYFIEAKIADGGMGSVYRATQLKPVKRPVALKVIRGDLAGPEVLERFEQERQTLAQMNHPQIARVLDAGTFENNQPYFAMELADGQPLDDYCREHQLSFQARVNLLICIAHAIEHAHRRGIIHRDLKPSNVLVSSEQGEPVVKVIDFGVAKSLDIETGDGATKAGQVLGTPQYMSPEQARAEVVDARSDVFSLGVILHRLVTGRTPLALSRDSSLVETLQRISDQEPVQPSRVFASLADDDATTFAKECGCSRKQLSQHLRGDLDWVLLRALSPLRTERYATARDFADDMQRLLDDRPVAAAAPTLGYRLKKQIQRHRVLFGAAVAILLVMLIAGGVSGAVWWDANQAAIARRNELATEVTQLLAAAESAYEQACERRAFWSLSLAKAEDRLGQAEVLLADNDALPSQQEIASRLRTELIHAKAMEQFDLALAAAREQGAGVTPLNGETDRDAGLRKLRDVLGTLGIDTGKTPPSETAEILSQVPPAFRNELFESLDFWLNEQPIGIDTEFEVYEGRLEVRLSRHFHSGDRLIRIEAEQTINEASQLTPAEADQLLAGVPGTRVKLTLESQMTGLYDVELTRVGEDAYWIAEVLAELDPHPWRTRLRRAILTANAASLRELIHGDEDELRRQSPFSLIQLAQKLPMPERGDLGIELLQLAQEEHPTNYWVNQYLGISLLCEKEKPDYINASRYFTAASVLNPDGFGPYSALGNTLLSIRQKSQAVRSFEQALKIAPERVTHRHQLAMILVQLERFDEAASQLETVLNAGPDAVHVVYELAQVYEELARYEDQVDLYERFSKKHPDNSPLQYCLAHAYRQAGRNADADVLFDGLMASPDWNDQKLGMWIGLNHPQDKPSYSPEQVRDGITNADTSAVAHKLMGYALLELRNEHAAIAVLTESLRLDPSDVEAHYFLGRAWEYLTNYPRAYQSYRAALELQPDDPRVLAAIAKFQR